MSERGGGAQSRVEVELLAREQKRRDDSHRSSLLSAKVGAYNQREMVHLVKEGVDVGHRTPEGLSLLDIAAQKGAPAVILNLIDAGADFTRDPAKFGGHRLHSALHWAAMANNESMARRWGSEGGSGAINAKNEEGQTPLSRALNMGHFGMADTLVSMGADPRVKVGPPLEQRCLLVEMASGVDEAGVRWCLKNGAMGEDAGKELAIALEMSEQRDTPFRRAIAGLIKSEVERRALADIGLGASRRRGNAL